jgi:hypothetical protein
VTFDNYVRVFKKNASYIIYLNGGRCGKGFSRDELRLRQVNQFGDERHKWPMPLLNTP